MKNLSKTIKLFLAAIFIGQTAYFYPLLPETVAIHFNARGFADDFTSKENYLFFQIGLMLFAWFFAKVNAFLINSLPISLINMPHREYWLAEDRRDATFKILQNYFDWLSTAMLAFFIGLNQLSTEANFREPIVLSGNFWFVLAAFLIFIAAWMYKFVGRFNKLD